MAADTSATFDEILAESVRIYPILYDKSCPDFKDRNKKILAWKDVANKVGLPSDKEAETAFKNLRNRYSRDKKKLKRAKVSGTGTKDVDDAKSETSELYTFLAWLEPYIIPRNSIGNLVQLNSSTEDNTGNDSDESSSVLTDPVDPDDVLVLKSKHRQAKKAKTVSKNIDIAEIEFLEAFGERLKKTDIKEKDEESIFGELIASQLRQLPTHQRTLAKMEVNNVLYSHLLKNSGSGTHNTVMFSNQVPEISIPQDIRNPDRQTVDMSNQVYTPGYLFQQFRGQGPGLA